MLQQTTVAAMEPYFRRFTARFPTLESLAEAPLDEVLRLWAGLGYYSRARNLHSCARAVIERNGGRFPETEAELECLPGIGSYTAAAVAAIAFDHRTVPVDGNVERVVSRLFAVEQPLPRARPLIRRLAQSLASDLRPGAFAQALMDLGATICTPKQPRCPLCPCRAACAARACGNPEGYPRRAPRSARKLRRGAAFFVRRSDGSILLRKRPPHGLLGGMTELPTTVWSDDFDEACALDGAPRFSIVAEHDLWRRMPGVVRHAFTHFPLELVVYAVNVPATTKAPEGGRWVAFADLHREPLPNVMRKVVAHATASG
jgi:A/G-specific adenine glycosylase